MRYVPTVYTWEQEHCPPNVFLSLSGQFCRLQVYIKRYQRDLCWHLLHHPSLQDITVFPSFYLESWDVFLRVFTTPWQHLSPPTSFIITFASRPCSGLSMCDNGSCSWKTLPLDRLSPAPIHGWDSTPCISAEERETKMPWTAGATALSFQLPLLPITSINQRGWENSVRRQRQICDYYPGTGSLCDLWGLEMKVFLSALL